MKKWIVDMNKLEAVAFKAETCISSLHDIICKNGQPFWRSKALKNLIKKQKGK